MNVSFIGAGNLAWHLAPALDNTEFAVKEIYSQHLQNASALVEKLYHAQTKATLDFSISPSRIFIIAVTDDAITEVAQHIKLPDNSVLIHTSGSQPLSLLGYAPTPNIGVLYPLQTFTKSKKIDFKDVPFFVESQNPQTEKLLVKMAKAISKKVHKVNSGDRKALHISAVFASNFTNHMLKIAEDLLDAHKLDFELLKPLIVETINKSLSIGPEKTQTGPARRGDIELLDKHVEFLKGDEKLSEIYKLVSQHIIDTYNPD